MRRPDVPGPRPRKRPPRRPPKTASPRRKHPPSHRQKPGPALQVASPRPGRGPRPPRVARLSWPRPEPTPARRASRSPSRPVETSTRSSRPRAIPVRHWPRDESPGSAPGPRFAAGRSGPAASPGCPQSPWGLWTSGARTPGCPPQGSSGTPGSVGPGSPGHAPRRHPQRSSRLKEHDLPRAPPARCVPAATRSHRPSPLRAGRAQSCAAGWTGPPAPVGSPPRGRAPAAGALGRAGRPRVPPRASGAPGPRPPGHRPRSPTDALARLRTSRPGPPRSWWPGTASRPSGPPSYQTSHARQDDGAGPTTPGPGPPDPGSRASADRSSPPPASASLLARRSCRAPRPHFLPAASPLCNAPAAGPGSYVK